MCAGCHSPYATHGDLALSLHSLHLKSVLECSDQVHSHAVCSELSAFSLTSLSLTTRNLCLGLLCLGSLCSDLECFHSPLCADLVPSHSLLLNSDLPCTLLVYCAPSTMHCAHCAWAHCIRKLTAAVSNRSTACQDLFDERIAPNGHRCCSLNDIAQ